VNEKELRNRLLEQPLRDEHIAEERTWDVVRAAFVSRERVARPRRVPWRPLLVLALVGGAIAVGVSPAGSTIANWVRDKVGRERVIQPGPVRPVLAKLPVEGAQGGLLVTVPRGVWVVRADGARRFIGRYRGATWSPSGKFVAAWDDRQVVALDPNVTDGLHWAHPGQQVLGARWSPSGYRVAYVAGRRLHVIVGNGTRDRVVAPAVAAVLPAWKPGTDEVLAYADAHGRIVVEATDESKKLWHTPRAPLPLALSWTDDGEQVVVLSEQTLRVFVPHKLVSGIEIPRRLYTATALAVRPATRDVAYAVYSRRTGQATVFLYNGHFSRPLFTGAGELDELAWSPDGRYLLIPWAAANQWLFVPAEAGGATVPAATGIAEQFSPGSAIARYPRVDGWCCTQEFSRG
jgi:hypothetical protein